MPEADEARELAEQLLDRLLAGSGATASSSFEAARETDDDEAYAAHVLARSRAIGPLMTACEDLADVMGAVDVEEALPAIRATADQWRRAADSLQTRDRRAVEVRTLAHRLDHLVEEDGLDPAYVADLVAIAAAQWELVMFATERSNLRSDNGRDRWWAKNGEQVRATAEIWAYLRADVVGRGGEVWFDLAPGADDVPLGD